MTPCLFFLSSSGVLNQTQPRQKEPKTFPTWVPLYSVLRCAQGPQAPTLVQCLLPEGVPSFSELGTVQCLCKSLAAASSQLQRLRLLFPEHPPTKYAHLVLFIGKQLFSYKSSPPLVIRVGWFQALQPLSNEPPCHRYTFFISLFKGKSENEYCVSRWGFLYTQKNFTEEGK